jgi:hypothetical protein
MAFFNPKEDVINIQLTSYGKHLISEGKFKPIYYSFLDDEVIYDYNYCLITESQSDIQDRIKENIRPETQAIFNGIETNVKKVNKLIRSNTIKFEEGERIYHALDNSYAFPASLGNSELNSENAPAWNIYYFNGEITGSINYITGSFQLLRIPRLTSDIIYETSIGITDPPEMETDTSPKPQDLSGKVYSDGTYIKVDEDYILMDIEEKNTTFTNENFQIEVFEMNINTENKISSSWTQLIPLQFVKKDKTRPPEEQLLTEELDLDNRFVEYFFELLVDEEIDKSVFCDALRKNPQRKSLFADKMPVKCEEIIEGKENTFDLPDDGLEECD